MRTTISQLKAAVQQYRKLTGKNYILRQRDSRAGGYGVCTQDQTNGSQGDDIAGGTAAQVYSQMWAKIRAIEEYQQIQEETPQFVIRIEDGIFQDVTAIGKKKFAFMQFDMDNIEYEFEEGEEEIPEEMTKDQYKAEYLKRKTRDHSALYCTHDQIENAEPDTIADFFG